MIKRLLLVAVFLLLGFSEAGAKQLIPMGTTVGVKLFLDQPVVIYDVELDGKKMISEGTVIEKINGHQLPTDNELKQLVQQTNTVQGKFKGEKITLQLNEQQMSNVINALHVEEEGVGTLTYIDPSTKQFGAIGHHIPTQYSSNSESVQQGILYKVKTDLVHKSSPGNPGYKVAQILDTQPLGKVNENLTFGVFGDWQPSFNESLPESIEIMQDNELQIGPAQMLYALDEDNVKSYAIKITKIDKQQFHFTITDEKLLKETGGIVQGMSGSPIIQNKKFVGAITHMFVETPESGVGLKILEMLEKR